MDNAGYVALTRQSGLLREMRSVAHNIANMSTTGYRREGLVFSEHVQRTGRGEDSLSMASADVRAFGRLQGELTRTGGTFDLAVQGEGYFLVETGEGQALTRAGAFTPNAAGDLVTADGLRVLDAGGAPIFVPPDAADISVAQDGTLSADGRPVAQIGLWRPDSPQDIARREGVLLALSAPPRPVEQPVILQGHLEGSNVDPVAEVTRMIEVQRAYELGQNFLQREDERARTAIRTLGQR